MPEERQTPPGGGGKIIIRMTPPSHLSPMTYDLSPLTSHLTQATQSIYNRSEVKQNNTTGFFAV